MSLLQGGSLNNYLAVIKKDNGPLCRAALMRKWGDGCLPPTPTHINLTCAPLLPPHDACIR